MIVLDELITPRRDLHEGRERLSNFLRGHLGIVGLEMGVDIGYEG